MKANVKPGCLDTERVRQESEDQGPNPRAGGPCPWANARGQGPRAAWGLPGRAGPQSGPWAAHVFPPNGRNLTAAWAEVAVKQGGPSALL